MPARKVQEQKASYMKSKAREHCVFPAFSFFSRFVLFYRRTYAGLPPAVLRPYPCLLYTSDLWKGGKPKKWFYAVPIILFWVIIVWFIVKAIWF